MNYLTRFARRRTEQRHAIPGTSQVPNSAGGFAWAVDDWARLRRFLILGSEGGSFYAGEQTLTRENATAVWRCVESDGARALAEIVAVSRDGRAAKNDPAIFALALAASATEDATRQAALASLPLVCRTSTHLFAFARYVEGFRGWGRSLRRGIATWYLDLAPEQLAYQAVKYRQRDGMTHRDLLRLAHPVAEMPEHAQLFEWIVRRTEAEGLPRIVEGFTAAQRAQDARQTAKLIRTYDLPREAVLPEFLDSKEVWAALLERMPTGALIRNLATLTRVGVLVPGSNATQRVVAQLGDGERLRKARVHPIAVLSALRTYAGGRGVRGRHTWAPVAQVVDALDAAFATAFGNVEPTGRRLLLALDVSVSMAWGNVAGVQGLTPREAAASMALVTAATEPRHEIVGFCAGGWFRDRGRDRHPGLPDGLTRLRISPSQRLDDAVRACQDLRFGGTDCALPMLYAHALEREVDTFVVYTDSDTWTGDVHPVQALRDYRRASGIDARLVVVGMVSNGFAIADPADAGMLDVVGFDTATPQLIGDFARGAL